MCHNIKDHVQYHGSYNCFDRNKNKKSGFYEIESEMLEYDSECDPELIVINNISIEIEEVMEMLNG